MKSTLIAVLLATALLPARALGGSSGTGEPAGPRVAPRTAPVAEKAVRGSTPRERVEQAKEHNRKARRDRRARQKKAPAS
jgi:hypothetical protein